MLKHKKALGIGLILIIIMIGINLFIKSNEEIGASISGSIGGISIDNDKFSNEEKKILSDICLSKRIGGINIKSEDAALLGNPTNDLVLNISYKNGVLSSKTYNYNLWIGSKIGYIQDTVNSKIYKLSSDENKFFIDSYLKYHTKDKVENIISKQY